LLKKQEKQTSNGFQGDRKLIKCKEKQEKLEKTLHQ